MNLKKELNVLRAYCAELKKDLADLEGWKYRCTEGNPNRKKIWKDCFRAMAKERKQWKTCEVRLVQQLRELQQHSVPAGLSPEIYHQYMTQNGRGSQAA